MDDISDWPNCEVAGCPRKCCLALNSPKCFPHTTGNEHVKRWKINARNADLLLASAIEAGTGETEGLDAKRKSAVPQADAQGSSTSLRALSQGVNDDHA